MLPRMPQEASLFPNIIEVTIQSLFYGKGNTGSLHSMLIYPTLGTSVVLVILSTYILV